MGKCRMNIARTFYSCLFGALLALPVVAAESDYAQRVNSTLGSKGKGFGVGQQYLEAGYTFPGPMTPFGMVQFTTTFFDESKGFVINQMSGAGCHNMGNLPMLPMPGKLTESPNDMMGFNLDLKIQNAHAGYYRASLFDSVDCELTVTPRTGLARLRFKQSPEGTVIIGSGINATEVTESNVKITGPASFEGMADGGNFCGLNSNYKVYFAGEFSRPSTVSGTWQGDSLMAGMRTAEGENSGVYFTFARQDDVPVLYKVGISYVSLENARLNLQQENPGWNFESVRLQAEALWNDVLGRVDVKGGSEDQTVQFYSHLYHCFAHPSVFNDVNGEYIGADFQVHSVGAGDYYTAFSNWDTYRTQIQLLSMLVPERASQMVDSMLTFADQAGGGFPRWVCANFETGVMQGDPTSVLIANAYAFGARDFNVSGALKTMRLGAEVPGTLSQKIETREHLDEYLNDGFISSFMGASMLLEYTSADYAIAQFARQAVGNEDLYRTYLERSRKWKNIYNPESTWLQSRNKDGSWKDQGEDWREASYKNYFWMIPYDLKELTDQIGGPEAAEQRLDEFFTKLNANYHEQFFAAGNEPSFQSPWTYNWIGKPYKAQETVRRIINEQYSNRDCGLPGNDDMGAMAAWYVFANLGLYPMIPGVGGFALNSPLFEDVTIHLGNGKTLQIRGGSEEHIYIGGLTVNNRPWESTWLPMSEVENGGTIEFKLSDKPAEWGRNELPPSYDQFSVPPKRHAWMIGPFERPVGINPIITPQDTTFNCPLTGKPIPWENGDTFNPGAIVKDGNICILYRAEDQSGQGIGQRTSRIGLATSPDGLTITERAKTPILYPAKDRQEALEWPGGCEDLRIAKTEAGMYVALYTQWNRKVARLAVAHSDDLIHWRKLGPAFMKAYDGKFADRFSKSASIVTTLKDGELVITKVNGKYLLYWGEKHVFAATSDDLINWTPLVDENQNLIPLASPRKGYFDSELTECGPPAVLTDDGIVLIYNGKNKAGPEGDPNYTANAYCAGQFLFDAQDPCKVIDRLDTPFLIPEESFEKKRPVSCRHRLC